ncbi:alpha/beta fold hydrolase [Nocardia takedensis]|uniref:alpha/beta fold hydrolase n=1 Tax=Nocardia takedensis TaxID=259390 RepID=UPI0002F6E11A|nr:alpha/beta hydrolase [Nocardia takedensis]
MTTSVAGHTLDVADARLHYEVRGRGPLVVLVGAPMGAQDFAPLAELLAADRTVVTTDPRGHGRSALADPDSDSTPEARGADLAALITHLGIGPAVVFGSSGGAVSALALAQRSPDLVTTVVAHEPPLIDVLADREELYRGTRELVRAHRSGDGVGAWRMFFAQAGIEMPEDVLTEMFGPNRDPALLADERYWFEHEILGTVSFEPDVAALNAAPTRIVVGLGAESSGQLCERTCHALAYRLGLEPMIFPGGHTGFLDDPAAFAPRLREVLRG